MSSYLGEYVEYFGEYIHCCCTSCQCSLLPAMSRYLGGYVQYFNEYTHNCCTSHSCSVYINVDAAGSTVNPYLGGYV